MELQFKQNTVRGWQDLISQTKTIQLAMESVVPDTKDDIGRILSVRPEIYLKSKELRNECAVIEGTAHVTAFYINETENAVLSFELTQAFRQEYDLPGVTGSDFLQLRFYASGIQSRPLNPRKLSVDLEVKAELTVSRCTEVIVSQELPETMPTQIYLKHEKTDSVLITGICEKNFSVNEQMSFPDETDQPVEIIGKELNYEIREREVVGSRLLIKGEAQMLLYYFTGGREYPGSHRFAIPFSQLIDLGEEGAESAEVWIVPTSDYLSLIEGIDGGKQLDIELHALAQVRVRRHVELLLIEDAYSNQFPCEFRCGEEMVNKTVREHRFQLRFEETFDLPEDFHELLTIFPSISPCAAQQGSAYAELLCRSKDGNLFAMRRSLSLESNDSIEGLTGLVLTPEECQVRQEGNQLTVQTIIFGIGLMNETETVRIADTLSLDEEQPFDCAAFPSMTAVWSDGGSVWELAKRYHSCTDAICSLNRDLDLRPLFIPKSK